jgi:thiol:disulfide interchange protein DsbD
MKNIILLFKVYKIMKKLAVILLISICLLVEVKADDKTVGKKSGNDYVKVHAYPSYDKIMIGNTIWLAFTFKMEKGWHIYWKNPGDAGLATIIKLDLPKGFKLVDIHYPNPTSFPFSNMVNFGYEKEVTLVASVKLDPEIKYGKYTINADISWLACKEECLPGKTKEVIKIEVADKLASNNEYWDNFEKFVVYPLQYDSTLCKARIEGNKCFLKITMPPYFVADNKFKFFPLEQGIFVLSSKQPVKIDGNFLEIELTLDPNRENTPESFNGLLVGEKAIVSKNDYNSFYLNAKFLK